MAYPFLMGIGDSVSPGYAAFNSSRHQLSGIALEVVQFSDLADDIRKTAAGVKPVAGRANGYLAPPFFTVNADGSHGMLRRECTSNYKIKPIQRRIKELLGRPVDKPIRRPNRSPARGWASRPTSGYA